MQPVAPCSLQAAEGQVGAPQPEDVLSNCLPLLTPRKSEARVVPAAAPSSPTEAPTPLPALHRTAAATVVPTSSLQCHLLLEATGALRQRSQLLQGHFFLSWRGTEQQQPMMPGPAWPLNEL